MATDHKEEEDCNEKFVHLNHSMQAHFDEHLLAYKDLTVLQPCGAVLVEGYQKYHPIHRNYPGKEGDIWVATFPKCGTTWTQEMVWCLIKGIDHKDSQKTLMERFPFFEWDSLFNPELVKMMKADLADDHHQMPGGQFRVLENQESPRLVKTHMLYQLMPKDVERKKAKIICVVRDPKDVCVSLFYHTKKFLNYTGDFDHFVQIFLGDLYVFGPYWANVLGFWNARHKTDILFLKYEDMKADLRSAIDKVAAFLKVTPKPADVDRMMEHLQFESMKGNPATNNETIMATLANSDIKFMRKGIVGDHKNYLSAAHIKQFKEWTNRWLKDSDFPYYRE